MVKTARDQCSTWSKLFFNFLKTAHREIKRLHEKAKHSFNKHQRNKWQTNKWNVSLNHHYHIRVENNQKLTFFNPEMPFSRSPNLLLLPEALVTFEAEWSPSTLFIRTCTSMNRGGRVVHNFNCLLIFFIATSLKRKLEGGFGLGEGRGENRVGSGQPGSHVLLYTCNSVLFQD